MLRVARIVVASVFGALALPGTCAEEDDEVLARRFLRCSAVMQQAGRQTNPPTARDARAAAAVFRVAASRITGEQFVVAELPGIIETLLADVKRQPDAKRGEFLQSQLNACNELYPTAAARVR